MLFLNPDDVYALPRMNLQSTEMRYYFSDKLLFLNLVVVRVYVQGDQKKTEPINMLINPT
jgi:hypothetical protein